MSKKTKVHLDLVIFKILPFKAHAPFLELHFPLSTPTLQLINLLINKNICV